MVTNYPTNNDLHPSANLIVSAMYTNPGSLYGKLQSIWELSIELCKDAEEKQKKRLSKFFGINSQSIFNSKSIVEKSQRVQNFNKKPEDTFVNNYLDLMKTIRRIKNNADAIIDKISNRPNMTQGTFDSEFIKLLLKKENFVNVRFLDKIIPDFFALQLHCFTLFRKLSASPGIPPDPIKRTARAKSGADARVIGKGALKKKFLDYIARKSNEGKKFRTIKEFFYECDMDLEGVLNKYKSMTHDENGRIINYGEKLTTESLPRIFFNWQKTDPIFKKHWYNIIDKKLQ